MTAGRAQVDVGAEQQLGARKGVVEDRLERLDDEALAGDAIGGRIAGSLECRLLMAWPYPFDAGGHLVAEPGVEQHVEPPAARRLLLSRQCRPAAPA